MTYREIARPIIRGIIEEFTNLCEKDLKREISKAYCFGERKYYPYKAWLLEVNFQLKGIKRKKREVRHDPAQLFLL